MNPFLAQASEVATQNTAIGGLVMIILVQTGKWLADWRKDKRELISDQRKQDYLKRIADSNEDMVRRQAEIKATLELNDKVVDARHQATLLALSNVVTNCQQNQKKEGK